MSLSPYALSIVEPVLLTDALLVSSNIAENDYPQWDEATTYALGDRVIVLATHRIYESLTGGNAGNAPPGSPEEWLDIGPTNRWKAWDAVNNTRTVTDGGESPSIKYVIQLDQAVTSVAALNVTGATAVNVTLEHPEYGTVYSKSASLSAVPIESSWWAWFFGQRRERSQHVALDLPSFPNCELTIELVGGVDLSVGTLIFGTQKRYGLGVDYGASLGIRDYSRKETNVFGDIVLVKRAYARWSRFSLLLSGAEVDSVERYLASIRATPRLWIWSKKYEASVVYGFYKNFEILISYPENSDCQLEIEGLI